MSFAPKQFIRSVDFLSTENATNTSTGAVNIYGGMSVSKNSYLTNAIITSTTITNLNVTGNLTTSSGNTLVSSQWTNIGSGSGVYFGTSANAFVGIATTTPGFNLDMSGGSRITGGLTGGNLNVNTGASITNLLSSTICSGTLILSTGISSGNNTMTNILATNLSTGTLQAPNGITVGNINFTGNLYQNGIAYLGSQWTTTSGNALTYTSGNVIISGTISSTNLLTTNVSVTNMNSSTNTIGTLNATGITSTSLLATNSVLTNVSVTNMNSSTNTIGTLNATGITTTSLLSTSASIGNISAGTINLSSNMNIAGTLTVVNVTTTNLTMSNGNALLNLVTSGSILNTGSISSGTFIGTNLTSTNIVATNLSSGNASITTALTVPNLLATTSISSGALYSTNQTTTNIVGTNTTIGGLNATGAVNLLSTTSIQNSTNNYSTTSGALNIAGDVVISGNELYFTTTGTGVPTMNGRGAGSKIILYPETGTGLGDYAIGIESANMWFQVPNSSRGFKFYQGTTANLVMAGGNLGINTTSPATTLDVSGSARFMSNINGIPSAFYVQNSNSGSNAYSVIQIGNDTVNYLSMFLNSTTRSVDGGLSCATIRNDGGALRLQSSAAGNTGVCLNTNGNVGIGTTSPSGSLHVAGSIPTSPAGAGVLMGIENNYAVIQFNSTTGSYIDFSAPGLDYTSRILVNSSGNIGINAGTNPLYTLDVVGTTRITNTSSTSMGTLIVAGPNSSAPATATSGQLASFYGAGGASSISNIDFSTYPPTSSWNNQPSVRFSMLDLGSGNSNFNILTRNSGSTGTMASRIFIDGSGNIGIRTTNPTDYLQVASVMLLTSTGNMTCTGDLYAFGTISDQRLKTNVENISPENALDTVKKLRPVTFNWKDTIFNEQHRGQDDSGFIAQEVEELIPHAVGEYTEIESGETYKNMRHERIIPYLTATIQKLIQRVEQNEKEIAYLKNLS